MIEVPLELLVLLGVLAVLSIFLTIIIRNDFRTSAGTFDPWAMIEGLVSLFFVLVMVAAAALQIFVRYFDVVAFDLHWTEELGRLALVWAAFWGAACLQRVDDHIRMTVLYDYIPDKGKAVFRIIGDVITLAVLVLIVWYGWQTARDLDIMMTIALGVPLSAFAYPVPIAGALMVIYTAITLVRRLSGHEPAPVASELKTEL